MGYLYAPYVRYNLSRPYRLCAQLPEVTAKWSRSSHIHYSAQFYCDVAASCGWDYANVKTL